MKDTDCRHCGNHVEPAEREHWTEGDGTGYGHLGLCCDCMDLSCGMRLEDINKERAAKRLPPITKPWKCNS